MSVVLDLEFVFVPAGEFIIGSDLRADRQAGEDELPPTPAGARPLPHHDAADLTMAADATNTGWRSPPSISCAIRSPTATIGSLSRRPATARPFSGDRASSRPTRPAIPWWGFRCTMRWPSVGGRVRSLACPCGCQPKPSGRRPRAATTAGSIRGATSGGRICATTVWKASRTCPKISFSPITSESSPAATVNSPPWPVQGWRTASVPQ